MAHIECICPAKPDGSKRHPDGDTVTLREALDFTGALAVRNVLRLKEDGDTVGDILAALTHAYLVHGIESWTLVDAEGKPIPVDRDAVRTHLLVHPLVAMDVGDEAEELYTQAVVTPLVEAASKSSSDTPIETSTSQPKDSSTPHPTPSSPSLTSTSQTDSTDATSMSLVGASSS
jgi:hypothetical protein